jgi:uncharacterized membrane protein/uncharacterized protein YndB with AHSA1/START domain
MSRVYAHSERLITARPEEVYAALIDYQNKRPYILTSNFLDYRVEEGGMGEGTVIRYRLQAAGRERPYHMRVAESVKGQMLTERDTNSSLVTTWTLTPVNNGQQTNVRLASEWTGGSGIGGFFERTFAPLGLRRIYADMLSQLAQMVQHPEENSLAKASREGTGTDNVGSPVQVYLRTTILGVVAGLRSMTPLALLSWTSDANEDATTMPSRLLQAPGSRPVTTFAAVGEAVADKLSITPSRTSPGPFVGRLVIGGLSGMVLSRRAHLPLVVGTITGVLGASAGTIAGYYGRTELSRLTKIPDPIWGGLEDILALSLGLLAVQKNS